MATLGGASALAPNWTPTWNMKNSTIIQPCNYSGFVEPIDFYAQFAIVDFDWSNAKALWVVPPMTDDLLLLEQCAALKAISPDTRCFVYRNLVKGACVLLLRFPRAHLCPRCVFPAFCPRFPALPWYTTVSAKINDPAYSGWFVKNAPGGAFPNGSYHVPQCDTNWSPPRCTDLYHDLDQTPGYPRGDGSCPGPCDCGGVPCGECEYAH